MTMTLKTLASLTLATALLAGCTSMNVFKDNSAPPPAADLEPIEPESLQTARVAQPTGLSAAEINKALAGKSWNWNANSVSGVTLYANDGSSLVEITGKGTTTGKWLAKNGELCESMAPAPFLPKGKSLFCNPISKTASGYSVGAAKFTLAN